MRKAGVLMPIASLPSRYGIGDLGKESIAFIDILKETGMKIWQILPLNPVGYGNSPYQPYSSFAGDEIYIDLEDLESRGLLEKPLPFHEADVKIEYEEVRRYKRSYLKQAFEIFRSNQYDKKRPKEYKAFIEQKWVKEYAVFLTLKEQNNLICWNEWSKEQQNWLVDPKYDLRPLEEEIAFHGFVQYIFYSQWMKLKAYANKNQVLIMGDIPFYVGIDSADVWADRSNFLLDKEEQPAFVAGVPPDFFSETGQRWGNPIYDWAYMKEDGYRFWINRLEYSSKLYDILRLDHFRAFDTYWKIPASCKTAIEGEWVEALGYDFFNTLLSKFPTMKIVVEDLGELRPEVLELKDYYHFKGMNIAEFNLLGKEMPKGKSQELIYTGTHDNQTLLGWYRSLSQGQKRKLGVRMKDYGNRGEQITTKVLRYVFESPAAYAIVPIQDLLGMGDEARLNTPGTVGSPNWEWRLENFAKLRKKIPFIKETLRRGKRI